MNTDFFSTASGVPIGIVIEDGIYKSSPGKETALTITDGQLALCETPAVSLTLTNQRSGFAVIPHHFNKWRSATGGVYLLNRDFSTVSTRTSTSGWYVRMRVVREQDAPIPALTVNSELELEVVVVLAVAMQRCVSQLQVALLVSILLERLKSRSILLLIALTQITIFQ